MIYNTMSYVEFIRELLSTYPETDGIFASSDLIASQVNSICHQMGIRIPQDLKLVGFDDVLISQLAVPSITTIHQPLEEMARAVIETIDHVCKGEYYEMEMIFR